MSELTLSLAVVALMTWMTFLCCLAVCFASLFGLEQLLRRYIELWITIRKLGENDG